MPTVAVTFQPEAMALVGLVVSSLVTAIIYLHGKTLSLAAERAVGERERAIRAEKINDGVLPILEKQSNQIERLIDQTEKLTEALRARWRDS